MDDISYKEIITIITYIGYIMYNNFRFRLNSYGTLNTSIGYIVAKQTSIKHHHFGAQFKDVPGSQNNFFIIILMINSIVVKKNMFQL